MKIKTVERIAGTVLVLTIGSFLIGGQSLLMKFIIGDVIGIATALILVFIFKIKLEV